MPKVLLCPECGYSRSWAIRRHHRRCKSCRQEWSPGSYHPVRGFRLARREWFRLIDSFLRDGTCQKVGRECQIAYATAQKAVSLIRQVLTADVPKLFNGVCEADETYVGGAWKNKAVHIRRRGSKRGRGTTKQAVFGLIQRGPSQVRVWLVRNSKGRTTVPLICQVTRLGSIIYTDGHKGYRRLPNYGYFHEWVDHEAGEYVRGEVHTQTIDGYWGMLKNHLAAIGGIRKERLVYFIGEHQWQYNFRHLTRREQVKRIYSLLTEFGGRN